MTDNDFSGEGCQLKLVAIVAALVSPLLYAYVIGRYLEWFAADVISVAGVEYPKILGVLMVVHLLRLSLILPREDNTPSRYERELLLRRIGLRVIGPPFMLVYGALVHAFLGVTQ